MIFLSSGRCRPKRSSLNEQGLPDPQTRLGQPIIREWGYDDYDVLADGTVVGRIFKVHAAPVGTPWMRTLAFGQHENRTPTHG